MGGDDAQKLRPWRGIRLLSGAQQTSGYSEINTFTSQPLPQCVAFTVRQAEVFTSRNEIQSVRKLQGQQLP
jgi:hypothetical protein